MKYKVIFFDVDDTLLDFSMSEKNALHKVFEEFGLPTGEVEYRNSYKEISKVLWRDLEQGTTTLSELGVERFRRLFLEHNLEIDAATFNRVYLTYLGKEVHLVPGAVDLFNRLTGCRLAIITNGFTDVQKNRIEESPLRNTFEHLIISEEAGFQKPDRGVFEYAFSKLKITDKTEVLIVGDSLTSDIQGGINYGIYTCWFNPNGKENHIGIQPTYEIRELTEIVGIVRKAGN
ncbi:YjjG family noncanonical pyrimidine nucleotidase [Bacillus sp. TL12]|uniref:YjjG family noncanonical pyrimidine nucleotidase n=1 Tax=Bacillus sp. TL12 TaxID=2894756 RepID=UPI001F525734|nr:YjjG family noncanonical pyrimidine nucleotidase [Bacillus sp. TL12]MCI0765475.1 YjjG family noncanonical pyrimidine nucleotidase [Bacillus sp. TL12]